LDKKEEMTEQNDFSKDQLSFIRDMKELLKRYGQDPRDWYFEYRPVNPKEEEKK